MSFLFMGRLTHIYRFLNVASIDVSAGAVISALFFVKVANARVDHLTFIALGLSVWIIYTIDHLLDVRQLFGTASTQRHKIHQNYFKVFAALLIVAGIMNFAVILFVDAFILRAGLLLGGLSILYVILQRYLSPFKEFCGGILYTMGILLPAFVYRARDIDFHTSMLIGQFLLTVWINLLLFSLFDEESDTVDKHFSFTTVMGKHYTTITIRALLVLCLQLGSYNVFSTERYPALILLAMDFILFGILWKRNIFGQEDRFRLIGDAVFLLPVVYVIV